VQVVVGTCSQAAQSIISLMSSGSAAVALGNRGPIFSDHRQRLGSARALSSSDMNPCTSLRKIPICLKSRMKRDRR